MLLPTLKKEVKAFLAGEEGKISKEKLVKMGVVAGIAAGALGAQLENTTAQVTNTPHSNGIGIKNDGSGFYGEHNHAVFHAQHSSHSSHSSHGHCW